MCTHLGDALATSAGSRSRLYIRGVRQTHGDMYIHAAASLTAPEGPCRGCEAKDAFTQPPGAQKHIKIEFTRCPSRCEAHPPLFLFSGQRRRDSLTTSGRRRSQMRLRPAIWEGKGFSSPPELTPLYQEYFSYKEKNQTKKNRSNRESNTNHNGNLSNYWCN